MLGAPGAGKGTQAKVISDKYNIPHISTGDIFRENIKNNTELGQKAKSYMDAGQLVPDELTCDLVVDRIAKADCADGFILDGFPRNIAQAKVLDETLDNHNTSIDYALNIYVPDDAIIERMSGRRMCKDCNTTYHIVTIPPAKEGICDKCGGELILREDDKPETVKKRLSVYHEHTKPLEDYFENKGVLKTIDGTMTMDEVFSEIQKFLDL